MKRLASFAAACAVALAATPSLAVEYSGVFPAGDSSFMFPLGATSMPLDFRLTADLSQATVYATLYILNWFDGTIDEGPGNPRYLYADSYDIYVPLPVSASGFDQIVTADPNFSCDPYRPPYFCEGQEFQALYLDAHNDGQPVDWALSITSVPEPQLWLGLLLGFGLMGAALRGGRQAAAPAR